MLYVYILGTSGGMNMNIPKINDLKSELCSIFAHAGYSSHFFAAQTSYVLKISLSKKCHKPGWGIFFMIFLYINYLFDKIVLN